MLLLKKQNKKRIDLCHHVFIFFYVGPVYHEGCYCPQHSGPEWEAHMHCPKSFPQIDRDLALYASVDTDRNAQEIPSRFGQRQSLCHYTVKDNKVFQIERTEVRKE